MEVVFTEKFVSGLEECITYIAQDDPTTATEWSELILSRCDQIADFPMSGRVVPEMGIQQIREVLEGKYRIVYEVADKRITFLLIWNSRMLLNEKLL